MNMCVNSSDDQEYLCTIFFCPSCCFSKTETFQKNWWVLCLVHASEMPEEQLLREARQFLLQEIESLFLSRSPSPGGPDSERSYDPIFV